MDARETMVGEALLADVPAPLAVIPPAVIPPAVIPPAAATHLAATLLVGTLHVAGMNRLVDLTHAGMIHRVVANGTAHRAVAPNLVVAGVLRDEG